MYLLNYVFVTFPHLSNVPKEYVYTVSNVQFGIVASNVHSRNDLSRLLEYIMSKLK